MKHDLYKSIIATITVIYIIGIAYKFTGEKKYLFGGQRTLVYTVSISNVRPNTLQYYDKQMLLLDQVTGEQIGRIIDVRSETAKGIIEDTQGGMSLLEIPEKISIDIDIETQGFVTDRAYYANGTYELKAGAEVFYSTKYIDGTGLIRDIEIQ